MSKAAPHFRSVVTIKASGKAVDPIIKISQKQDFDPKIKSNILYQMGSQKTIFRPPDMTLNSSKSLYDPISSKVVIPVKDP